MAAGVERRAACGASYNACASGATPRKFETRQPARPAGKARADRQFQRRVSRCYFAFGDGVDFAFSFVARGRGLRLAPEATIVLAARCCGKRASWRRQRILARGSGTSWKNDLRKAEASVEVGIRSMSWLESSP